jgi:acyl carrier protein
MDGTRKLVRDFVLETLFIDQGDGEEFNDDTNIRGRVDSLAVLQLITFVEEQFKVELRAQEFESNAPVSISSIEKLVLAKKVAGS